MSATATPLPSKRAELLISPSNRPGEFVVKNPRERTYFRMGEQECFLLNLLDGQRDLAAVKTDFASKFGDPLSDEDVQEFIEDLGKRGLLTGSTNTCVEDEDDDPMGDSSSKAGWLKNPLYFRVSLFDPDHLLNVLEPRVRFFWTRGFFFASLAMIMAAAVLAWLNRDELFRTPAGRSGVNTAVLAWVVIIFVTMLHEFAHGLTCKHFGGEVHEIGVLMIFGTPCMYCNVSDAWLIPERSKRLWITAAGGYWDLCMFSVATLVWRFTAPETFINYVSWIVVGVCGFRGLINFNPLLRLDGYYLLSDFLQVPNMRRRARTRCIALLRSWLWGAERPEHEENANLLTAYGAFLSVFSFLAVDMMYLGLCKYLGEFWGLAGVALATVLFVKLMRALFSGFFSGEVGNMVTKRPVRLFVWLVGGTAVLLGAFLVRVESRASGTFQVRPSRRVEIRSQVAGFLRAVNYTEGAQVPAGSVLCRMEVPDLDTLIAQKSAEVQESQAVLKKLQAGPRREEVNEQQLRVERIRAWRDMAAGDVEQARIALAEDLNRYTQQMAQYYAEVEYAAASLTQANQLYERGVMAGQQYLAERKRYDVAVLQYRQAEAQKRAREATGTLDADAELARRNKELADAEAQLRLMQAGTRREEIEAERARQTRLEEELRYLNSIKANLDVPCPIAGVMTTPRVSEKIGQFFEKGALICEIEDATGLEAEIALPEQDVAGVRPGQLVELKARAMPFETFHATVEHIAPRAAATADKAGAGTVTVYCRLGASDASLLAGMTGVGRISKGPSNIASITFNRLVKYLRTEFWW